MSGVIQFVGLTDNISGTERRMLPIAEGRQRDKLQGATGTRNESLPCQDLIRRIKALRLDSGSNKLCTSHANDP